MVGAAVLALAILLVAMLSQCSAPPKEVRRGPIRERLDLVVEPPAHYVR